MAFLIGGSHFASLVVGASQTQYSISAMYGLYQERLFADSLDLNIGPRLTVFFLNQSALRSSDPNIVKAGHSRTVTLNTGNVSALNLFVSGSWWLSSQYSIGANVDVIGWSLGGKTTLTDRLTAQSQAAEAPGQNVFTFGQNDRGALTSEFYIGFRVDETQKMRAGFSRQVIEYRSPIAFAAGNKNFRTTANVLILGIDTQL